MSNTGLTYLGDDIFTYASGTIALNGGVATKSVEIPAADLQIALKNSITLPTVADYEAFKAQLHTGSICIPVSEAP